MVATLFDPKHQAPTKSRETYMVQRPERGEEPDVLGEVRQEPQVMVPHAQDPDDDEDDEPNDSQAQDHAQESCCRYTQVVNTLSVGKK